MAREMTPAELVRERLRNQQLAAHSFRAPAEVVGWMGALQAQDYAGSLWAIGLRLPTATEQQIEEAIRNRSIVRTWPMRGTLHFVAATDIRWLLDLMAPRVLARTAPRYRQLELDDHTLGRAHAVLAEILQGGRQLTRQEIATALEEQGIGTEGQRFSHILQHAEINGLICYGTRRGKQFTFVLLDEWVPARRTLDRAEALAELARRYFQSHGPATLQDFVWWSGLTTAECRQGIAAAGSQLRQAVLDGQTYWTAVDGDDITEEAADTHLLPAFDEYVVAYRDRSAISLQLGDRPLHSPGGMLDPVIVRQGQVVGTWRRTLRRHRVIVEPTLLAGNTEQQANGLAPAAERYAAFLGVTAELVQATRQTSAASGEDPDAP